MSQPSEEDLREAVRRAAQTAADDERQHASERLRDALNEKR